MGKNAIEDFEQLFKQSLKEFYDIVEDIDLTVKRIGERATQSKSKSLLISASHVSEKKVIEYSNLFVSTCTKLQSTVREFNTNIEQQV